MKCINDNSELVLKTQEGVLGCCCNQCNGLFLDSKGVDAFKYNFETDLLEKAFKDTDLHQTSFKCCQCNGFMEKSGLDLQEIFICKSCKCVFFNDGQITQIKNKQTQTPESDLSVIYFLPSSIVAIFALFKFFTLSPDSKNKAAYGWLFIIAVFFSVLFWSEISSYQCGS